MIQFTPEEVSLYRQRIEQNNSVLTYLLDRNHSILEQDLIIPTEGIATWGHYYYCPQHSVKLEFNLQRPNHHICPVDGAVFTGEPYDGAWWRLVNGMNAQACYELSLIWLLTEEELYLNKVKAIMLTYAKYYMGYEEHGNIPHNGPGKANAQTLCEATWISDIAKGYDIIKSTFSVEEQEFIENNLLIPCAEFLCKHRTDQLHNHEIIISGAIGILGILLDQEDLIEFALHQKYGLYYQLEHGVLEDYFWFEGSPAYHYYALEAFFRFEVFARHTPYHQLSHPYYREMFQMPLKLLQPDLTFPLLNDMKPEQGKLSAYQGLYEFAYSFYGDWEFAWVLSKTEALEGKAILESFFFGKEVDLGDKEMEFTNYHHETGSGLTILRGDNESYLLFKHSPFGGEHDHYDRLATSFSAFGEKMITDLGTTGYGALLHYDYYKNTGSHNTVMINEENQPPANPTLHRYQQEQDMVLIDAEVKWDNSFKELDSHTRVEWDEESYKDVSMRRILLWCNQYYIEVFLVQAPTPKTIQLSA